MRDYDEDESGALTRGEFVRLVGQARRPVRPQQPDPMTRRLKR